jgi:hypothetical protein
VSDSGFQFSRRSGSPGCSSRFRRLRPALPCPNPLFSFEGWPATFEGYDETFAGCGVTFEGRASTFASCDATFEDRAATFASRDATL